MASKPVTIWLTLLACPALLLIACSRRAEPSPPPPPPPEPVSAAARVTPTPAKKAEIEIGASTQSALDLDDVARDTGQSSSASVEPPAHHHAKSDVEGLYATTDTNPPSTTLHPGAIKNAAIPGMKPVIDSAEKSPDQSLDGALANLVNANAAFQHPKEMAYGESKIVTLRLSETETAGELTQDLQGKDVVVDANAVPVSEVMQAHLVGSSFTIDPISPEVQPISARQATIWEWNVTPKEFGQLTITLAMNAKITVAGKERSRFIRTFTETIVVPVKFWNSVGKFFVDNWQWFATTLIIPLVVWYWHQRHKSRRRQAPPTP
jgi:hypothetical protein